MRFWLAPRSITLDEYQTYNICNFATTYDGQTAEKVCPTYPVHPSTATAQPPTPICSECKYMYVTSKPETRVWPFPNPKTRVYRRNPGLETLSFTPTPTKCSHFSSVGTEQTCCPKSHFPSVQIANSVQNSVQISNFRPKVFNKF